MAMKSSQRELFIAVSVFQNRFSGLNLTFNGAAQFPTVMVDIFMHPPTHLYWYIIDIYIDVFCFESYRSLHVNLDPGVVA